MEKAELKASIVIRVYNAEATLARAIDSALAQDFPHEKYEIIIVDDGSTDSTPDIVKRYTADARVRIIRQQNAGAITAANRGIQEAKGEYVSFLDSDDYLEPEFLAALTGALKGDPDAALAFCDYWQEQNGSRKRISPQTLYQCIFGNMLFRGAALKKEGDLKDIMFAEYELFLRTEGRWRSAYVAEPLLVYVRHGENLSANAERVQAALDALRKAHPDKHSIIESIRRYD